MTNCGDALISGLYCRYGGKGTPILVVHGGPGLGHRYLLPGMSFLEQFGMAIFYDQRGTGQFGEELTEVTNLLSLYLEDMERIRVHFGFDAITLLGHSWGGFLAAQYAKKYPQNVERMIFLNSVPLSKKDYADYVLIRGERIQNVSKGYKPIVEATEFLEMDERELEKYFRTMFSTYLYDSSDINKLDLAMAPQEAYRSARIYETFLNQVMNQQFDLYTDLRELHIKTAIIHGDADPIPVCYPKKLQNHLVNSELCILKNCGHFPFVEQPNELVANLQLFLEKPIRNNRKL